MSTAKTTHGYPMLPTAAASSHWYLSTTMWIVVAVVLHGFLYGVALWSAKNRPTETASDDEVDHSFIMVTEPPEIEPAEVPEEPEQADEAGGEAEAEEPELEPEPVEPPKEKPKKEKPPEPQAAEPEEKPVEFKDVGVLGSLSEDATGAGGSSFRVATGSSGVDGAIGTRGKIVEKARPGVKPEKSEPVKKKPVAQRVVSARNLSRKAKPNHAHNKKHKAPYPQGLRESELEGVVRAVLTVRADGTVSRVKIVKSDHPAFEKAAISVLKKFVFEPALDKEGQPVASKVSITYLFTLE